MKRFLALLLAMTMVLSLVACGEKAPATDDGAAVPTEKVLTVGITTDPQVVNPLNDNNGTAFELSSIMFLPLMETNDQLEFVPALASEVTTEDNVVFTIKLQEGIKWADGEEVTADDVIFTLNLITNPAVGSTVASYLNCIAGTESTGWMAEGVSVLEGVAKVDEYTLTVTCKEPVSTLSFLCDVANRVRIVPEHVLKDIPAENVLQSEFALAPTVGNGAFVFKEYVSGQYVSMAANPNYYKGAPKLSQLNFVILSSTQMATQLETGEIDMAYPGSVESGDYESLLALEHIRALDGDPVSVRNLIINNAKVDNVMARQAMNLAIDRALIVNQMMGGYANAQATIVTPASKYYNAEANKVTYDVEEAKRLLVESGWDASQTLVLNVANNSELNTRIATLVAQELEEVGFNIEISESDMATMMSGLFGRQFDMALMNITDDPLNLPFNFAAICQSSSDWTGYHDERMEELLGIITSLADEETIAAAYSEIQEILARDVPAVTLYASCPLLFTNTRVTYGEPKLYGMFTDVELWDVQ